MYLGNDVTLLQTFYEPIVSVNLVTRSSRLRIV